MANTEGPISLEFTEEEKTVLTKLEEKYGRITPFKVAGHGLVVLRKPSRPEWRKYNSDLSKPQVDALILHENFAKQLTCYPDNGGVFMDSILDDFPGLSDVFEIAIRNLATGERSEVQVLGKDWKTPAAT